MSRNRIGHLMKEIINGARKDMKAPCACSSAMTMTMPFRWISLSAARRGECRARAHCAQNRTVAFDWNRGYIAEMSGAGIAATDTVRNLYVASLGHVCAWRLRFDDHELPPRHHEPAHAHGQLSPTRPMWVRTHNGYNDSRQKKVKPVPVEPLTVEQEEEISKPAFAD